MSNRKLVLVLLPLLLGFDYPDAKKGEIVDDYHGTKVADPYRWLEDPDSPETRAWIEAQNKITFDYLEKLPTRKRFKTRLTELQDYERYGIPQVESGRYFFERNSGLQNQAVLYTVSPLEGEPRMLLDPNTLSTDGTVALAEYELTPDGKLLAYSTSTSGSDWREWRVRDVESGKDLPDVIQWAKFSDAAWSHDGKGFYYGAYDPPKAGTAGTGTNYYQKLYYHRLGTSQKKDQLVLQRKDQKEWGFNPQVTDDGRYLVVTVWKGSAPKNMIWVKDLSKKGSKLVELVNDFDAQFVLAGSAGQRLYFVTDKDAPRWRVVAVDLGSKDRVFATVIPEAQAVIDGADFVNDTLIVRYLEDAQSRVSLHDKEGKKLRDVKLPGVGKVAGFAGQHTDKETFYSFESFAVPKTIYRYDLVTGESTLFRQPKVAFDPNAFETRLVFAKGKDGTRLPVFLTHKKGLQPNGQNPTLLYGYGGFNNHMQPGFKVQTIAWIEAGGVYAHAITRGDGAYGREFHEQAMIPHKQRTFDDFIAVAEFLIATKITSPAKLAIHGGSNGGLLVGAVMNQRPELFACALPAVGVMDMLRFHKFTIGWGWVPEYGSSDDPEQLEALLAISPLHNLKPGTKYPATLITTADHDDRVVPAHSFKYAAALQAAQAGPAPVLIRIETKAGHGAGKPTRKVIEEAADRLAFTAPALGMTKP